LAQIKDAGYEVRAVEPFCPHWRKHFTWKVWCWNDAPATRVLWLDAGVAVLRPLDEVFLAIRAQGYFVVPTYYLLSENASADVCRGCGVRPEFRQGRLTFAGGIIGFDRSHDRIGPLLREALALAGEEENLRATEPGHRHDQALISLLLHKHCGHVVCSDGLVYAGWTSPRQVPGQKIWVHRGSMRPHDHEHFVRHLASRGAPLLPSDPAVVVGGPPQAPMDPWADRGLLQIGAALLRDVICEPGKLLRAPRFLYRVCRHKLTGRWPEEKPRARIYDGVAD